MLKPGHYKTFQQYREEVFLSYVQQQLKLHVNRIDIVWGAYNTNSLKTHTREKRGNGERRRVEPNSPIPTNWDGFLRVDKNKKELFTFLTATCSTADCLDKKAMSSYDQSVVSNTSGDIGDLSPCTHEKADTRIFVHCVDSVRESNERLMIRTVYTDLAVIAISGFREAQCQRNMDCISLWQSIPLHQG